MKTVIVSPELIGPHKNGGIGTFTTLWASLLRENGDDVTLIYTGDLSAPRQTWIEPYDRQGIEVIHAKETDLRDWQFNYEWFVRRSEVASARIPADTDVIYFQDWQANGYHFLRKRQFERGSGPVCVSVLHGFNQWVMDANKRYPASRRDMEQAYAERYVVARSDYVVTPSQYMLDYVRAWGWNLPDDDHVWVLGYPMLPQDMQTHSNGPPDTQFRRLIFWGRVETRKGIEVFADGLRLLHEQDPARLNSIMQVVLLGRHDQHRFGTAEALKEHVQHSLPQADVVFYDDFDSGMAQRYLFDHARDSLVVAPSLADNFPYAVIEASLIPGVNLICSNVGGQAEILGDAGTHQFFLPQPRNFAQTLSNWLAQGPRDDGQLAHYDWLAANQRWLAFHHKVGAQAQARTRSVQPVVKPHSTLDVILTYYNLPDYLPAALQSLDQQTTADFNLYVINDASTDAQAIRVFQHMQARYAHHARWQFLDEAENRGLSGARNTAVACGTGDYLLFMDADNIAAPGMVERFSAAADHSDYDCLTCYVYGFEGDDAPFIQPQPGLASARPYLLWAPLGDSRELNLFHDCYGDANFLVKRGVFQALRGFEIDHPLDRYTAGEDYEFLTRLVYAGYRLDVIPEFLLFYRYRSDSLMRTAREYDFAMRGLEVYRDQLRSVGLQHLIPWIRGLYQQAHAEGEGLSGELDARRFDPVWLSEYVPWRKLVVGLVEKARKRLLNRMSPHSRARSGSPRR
ncbi:MAG: glycosyltransferase [Anaerolineae bacterium]|nr:glycosyltransferase [Anaerolineae bacterium]